MKLGIAGLGIIGGAMARNLLKAGFRLSVWNRTREKAAAFGREGAAVAASLPELAAESEAVLICVNDTPDVEAVLFGPGGLSEGLSAGKIVVDMSTISPEATVRIAARLRESGCDMLDAPVSGGDVGARQGTLTIMVGGEEDIFKKMLPVFRKLGGNIVHCGGHGDGQRVKMINQVLCGLHTVALAEAFVLAEKVGVAPEIMHKVVTSGAANSWALENYGTRLLRGDLAPGFKLSMQQKDLRIAVETARARDVEVAGAELALRLFTEAKAAGLGDRGAQALIELYRSKRGD